MCVCLDQLFSLIIIVCYPFLLFYINILFDVINYLFMYFYWLGQCTSFTIFALFLNEMNYLFFFILFV